jgi:hypothetical protein
MVLMKKFVFVIYLLVAILSVNSQNYDLKTELYKLEGKIIDGDIGAFKEMARYLDDTTFVQEFLGYHNYPNTARGIAIRVFEENTLFTKTQFQFDSSVSSDNLLALLSNNKVVFDPVTGTFLITELTRRETRYLIKELSEYDLKKITRRTKSDFPEWYYQSKVDDFLMTKNSGVLLVIASEWYKKRSRFNRYYFNDYEFLDLMKSLTHVDLGTPDRKNTMTFLYNDDYEAIARLNYLTYWANHYMDYKWSSSKGYFVNEKQVISKKTPEENLFPFLIQKNDSLAMRAFIKLAEMDTAQVRMLADEYERNNLDRNGSIPTFPFRFLKQMVVLTQYCREKGIKYKANGWLFDSLTRLGKNLEFTKRYELENELITKLKLDDITAVEYWGLMYQQNWWLTYSMGRIIDKFYSKNWKEILTDSKQITLFLKKAELFDKLGIIGICNKYLRKFQNSPEDVLQKVRQLKDKSTDNDVIDAASKVVNNYGLTDESFIKELPKVKIMIYGVSNLRKAYSDTINKYTNSEDRRWPLLQLFANINYAQLGEAIELLLKGEVVDKYRQFWIIENDFGLDVSNSNKQEVTNFLKLYNSKTEYDVYKFYFEKTGIKALNASGDFLYDEVYEVLKYDVVDAFVGGGGSRREKGVYPLIRMLELKFKTRLGFPEKFCESEGVYSCDCTERAKAWMGFLEGKGYAKPDKTEPISISYN